MRRAARNVAWALGVGALSVAAFALVTTESRLRVLQPEYVDALYSGSVSEQCWAAERLSEIGGADAVRALVFRLQGGLDDGLDLERAPLRCVVDALVRLGTESVPTVIDWLRVSPESRYAAGALRVLERIGPSAVDDVFLACRSADWNDQKPLLSGISSLVSASRQSDAARIDAACECLAHLVDEDYGWRGTVVANVPRFLTHTPEGSALLMPRLWANLESEDSDRRMNALPALGTIADFARSTDAQLKANMLSALGKDGLQRVRERATDLLVADEHPIVRREAVRVLMGFRPLPDAARDAIQRATADHYDVVSDVARAAATKLGGSILPKPKRLAPKLTFLAEALRIRRAVNAVGLHDGAHSRTEHAARVQSGRLRRFDAGASVFTLQTRRLVTAAPILGPVRARRTRTRRSVSGSMSSAHSRAGPNA